MILVPPFYFRINEMDLLLDKISISCFFLWVLILEKGILNKILWVHNFHHLVKVSTNNLINTIKDP